MNFKITVDKEDVRPVYSQIIENIKQAVLFQTLEPGEKVPSVRKLAERLNINRNTVFKAYRILEEKGFLVTRKGLGTYIAEEPPEMDEEEILEIMKKRIDKVLRDSYHLKIPISKIREMLNDRIKEFIVRQNPSES